jgi:hypothetical protein
VLSGFEEIGAETGKLRPCAFISAMEFGSFFEGSPLNLVTLDHSHHVISLKVASPPYRFT